MNLADAFNALFNLQGRQMSLSRLKSGITVSIKAAPSNYSRVLGGPGSTTIEGYEFVLSVENLNEVGFPIPPRQNDRLIDPQYGTLNIEEVIPLPGLGGGIIGYRVRSG